LISKICEAFSCTPAEAMQQDLELCEDIIVMRYFQYVYDDMKRDPKTLTPEREKFLEQMEQLSN
jgi:hypothetical protein